MDPLLVGLINVLSAVFIGWFFVMVLRHMSRSQREASGKEAQALRAALDEAEAERDRLRARIEAVEAIVTSEGFDLERDARRALGNDLLSPLAPEASGAAPRRQRVR